MSDMPMKNMKRPKEAEDRITWANIYVYQEVKNILATTEVFSQHWIAA